MQVVQIVLWYLDSGYFKTVLDGGYALSYGIREMKKVIETVRFGAVDSVFHVFMDHFGVIMGYGNYVLLGDSVISRDSHYVCRDIDGVELIKGTGTINDLARMDLVRGLPRLKFEKYHLCSACQLEKSKKHTHKPKTENTNLEVLNTLHMDLCGPMRVQTINGKKYILVIVDDYSRFTWVRFLKLKDETPEVVIKFLKQIQVGLNKTIRYIRTDNGTEFVNKYLTAYYECDDIFHQKTAPRTPQQNGVVERRNCSLVEAARTMLIFSKAPMFLWAEAVATACYTKNRSLVHTLHNKTPYELVHDKKYDLTFFCVFGALCYPTNDSEDLEKLQPTADIGIFVGYAPSRKGTGPAPTFLTPGQISSGLVPNPVPAAPSVPPTNKELEILFQPMFDEYLEPPRVERLVSPAPTSQEALDLGFKVLWSKNEGTNEVLEGTAQEYESTAGANLSTAESQRGSFRSQEFKVLWSKNEGTNEVLEGTAQEYESTAGANLSTAEVYESTAHSLFKISETESDEFIKSSVENLVQNPSESTDLSDGESECDVPINDDSPESHFTIFSNPLFDSNDDFSSDDESLSEEEIQKDEFKYFSNPLYDLDDEIITNEEILPNQKDLDVVIPIPPGIDKHCFNAESDLLESLLNRDSPIYSTKIDSTFDEFSLPRPPEESKSEYSDATIESLSPSPIPVEDSDPFMEEIGIFLASDDSTPPGVESDYDSEGDILLLEELLNDDLVPLAEYNHFTFDVELDTSVKNDFDDLNEDECFDPGGGENVVFLNVEEDDSFTFTIRTFLPFLTYSEVSPLLSSTKNEDTIFDPGIST
ncbi:retrovirus-related pol polyprotein from transposon TNT 1-94 [Tanacetum coccineum]